MEFDMHLSGNLATQSIDNPENLVIWLCCDYLEDDKTNEQLPIAAESKESQCMTSPWLTKSKGLWSSFDETDMGSRVHSSLSPTHQANICFNHTVWFKGQTALWLVWTLHHLSIFLTLIMDSSSVILMTIVYVKEIKELCPIISWD